MSFSISYTYKVIDKFSPVLKQIETQVDALSHKLQGFVVVNKHVAKELNQVSRKADAAAKSVAKVTKAIDAPKKMDSLHRKLSEALTLPKQKDNWGSHLKLAQKGLAGFATSAASVASSLGGGMLLGKTAKDAMSLEDSIINLKKAFDTATPPQLTTFQDELKKVAKLTANTQAGINEMGYEAGKLGIPIDEVAKYVAMGAKAAVAFDIKDTGEMSEYMSSLRVKLGLNNAELEKTLDTINYIDDKGSASSKGILEIMSRTSGIFSSLKVPADVSAAFAGTAEKLAETPADAATGLKMMIQRMQDVSKFSPKVAEGMTKDFTGTVQKVLGALNKMPTVQRNLAVQDLFGDYAAPFVLNMIDKTDLLSTNLSLAADKTNALGSANREFEKKAQAASFAVKGMKAELTDLSAEIGFAILPLIKQVGAAFKEWGPKISSFVAANPGIVKFGLALTAIVVILAPLALALSALAAVAAFLATPIGIAIAAVAGFTALLVGLGLTSDEAAADMKSLWACFTSLYDIFDSFMTLGFSQTMSDIGGGISEMFKSFVGFDDITKSLNEYSAALTNLHDIWTSFTTDGFVNTLKDLTGAGLDAIGFEKAALDIASTKSSVTTATLNGNIDVTASGGAQVKRANLVSLIPGDLGFNAAGSRK